MFGTFRRHQTWLWWAIITVIVITFVVYFSPYSKLNSNERRLVNYGAIDGETVSEQEFNDARREADLHYFFMNGRWLEEEKGTRTDPLRETYQWLVLVRKQEAMGIHPSDEVTGQMGRDLVRALERLGVSSPAVFIEKILKPRGLGVSDFERFLRHYVGLEEMISTRGLSGKLITPAEVKALYEREHQPVATEAVFFSASNYLASVRVTPEAVSEFYSNRVAFYRLPDRVQVNYVRFNLTNFLPQAEIELKTNLAEQVELNFTRLGTNYVQLAKTPEEAKARIREELLNSRARDHARKQAFEFANRVLEIKPERSDNLATLAKKEGLPNGVSAPFDREDRPSDLDVGADFAKFAFGLTPDDPVGGPVVGRDGVYVISLNKKLPATVPALDQIRERVTADYKRSQALEQARQAALAVYPRLTNALAQGKTFTNVCAQAGLKPVILPPFSISTRSLPELEDQIGLNQLKQAAFTTPLRQLGSLQPTSEGGMLLYVRAKLPIDLAQEQEDLPLYTSRVRLRLQEEAFNRWFSREYTKELREGLRNIPLGQPQQQPQTPPPAMNAGGGASKTKS